MPVSNTTIRVPALYEMRVIKARCRNATNIGIIATFDAQVRVAEPSDVKPAFTVEGISTRDKPEEEIFSVGGTLYTPETRHTASDMLNPTGGYGCPFEEAGRYESNAAWPQGNNTYRNGGINQPGLIPEADIPALKLREVFSNNRDNIAAIIQTIADNYIVSGDTLYRRCGEPYYYVHGFGLGNNHGGSTLANGSTRIDGTVPAGHHTVVYNALQREEGLAAFNQYARERGDTLSVGTGPLHNIIVHDPDMVKLPPGKPEDEAAA